MVYVPSFLTVPVGSTVTFILVNGYDPSHPLGFDPPYTFSISSSMSDLFLTYTFTKPGSLTYYCTIHGDSGLLVVEPEPDPM
jgi:plastocyanin